MEAVGEGVRLFLNTLWNTYSFYVLYANVNGVPRDADGERTELDRWILSRLSETVETARERLDDYDTTSAGRAIAAFVDDLSNWYVRLSRRRFWDGEPGAMATLRECLLTLAKTVAPLTPRSHGKIKLRQPLREAVIVAAPREREAIEEHERLVLDELNVKALRYVSEADELGRWELKPNYRTLGPRFGKDMPNVAEAVAALDASHAAATLRDGGTVGILLNGTDHPLSADDVQLALQPLEGYQVERAGTHAVALNLELDDELRREGLAREVVHAIQNARKTAGLNVEDRISLTLGGNEELLEAVRANEEYVTGETLATSLAYNSSSGEPIEIEGKPLTIEVERE
jgi:isoleucyl-tRNA synthetase